MLTWSPQYPTLRPRPRGGTGTGLASGTHAGDAGKTCWVRAAGSALTRNHSVQGGHRTPDVLPGTLKSLDGGNQVPPFSGPGARKHHMVSQCARATSMSWPPPPNVLQATPEPWILVSSCVGWGARNSQGQKERAKNGFNSLKNRSVDIPCRLESGSDCPPQRVALGCCLPELCPLHTTNALTSTSPGSPSLPNSS